MIVLHILLRCLGITLLVCHMTGSVILSIMLVIELMGVTSASGAVFVFCDGDVGGEMFGSLCYDMTFVPQHITYVYDLSTIPDGWNESSEWVKCMILCTVGFSLG